ncbi:MAG TPA: PAS domain-containing protein [Sphingobium sp.]|uniref:PAS domain-containing protein n=1 Tax=Sphingobium sp. TaxID=1912891 RepID=UPI002ED2E816
MFPEKLTGKVVSATAFVRNFGAYARTAGSEPIHILNHGRPAWSLIATDHLARLSDARSGGHEHDHDRLALSVVLDTITTKVIMLDADLRIIRVNPSARHAMMVDDDDIRGVPLGTIMSDIRYQFILRAIERVRDTGVSETFEVDTVSGPPRTYNVKVEMFASGIVMFADETTAQTLVRDRLNVAHVYEALMDALPGLARGTINARGVITAASPALAELVQTDPGRIVGMRLSSLFHTSVRTAVADSIETLLDDRTGFTMTAVLQAGGTETTSVMLSASPNPTHGRDDGAIFLLQKSAA